jgi:predicted DNA-binding transcriptional regulator YafY
VHPLRKVELTDAQLEALLSAAELAEAAWWDSPMLQRRLAALTHARRTMVEARTARVDGRASARSGSPSSDQPKQ